MRVNLRRYVTGALAPLLAVLSLLVWTADSAYADEETIRVVSSSVTSEFPEGIRFKLEASGENEITSIAVRFRVGQRARGEYNYLDFERDLLVDSELFWRTNIGARYIPPGSILTYNFEIEDSEGGMLVTEPQEFIYQDARFQWEEVSKGPITVSYHGPVKRRAEIILDASFETLERVGPLLGADTEGPIRITMYNNAVEMLQGLPPGSTAISGEVITAGTAFADVGMLLVLGGDRRAESTAAHELTHILVHRAATSVFRTVPLWLNEGLAEYGNPYSSIDYEIALEFAVGTDRLMPITSQQARPSNSEEVIIFYGEARDITRFMVREFGGSKMRELLATLKTGRNIDDAILTVYGIDRVGLENLWREDLRAPPYTPPDTGSALPTPIPLPTVLIYSLTPQPESETIGDVSVTPTPEPTATPTAQPVARAEDATPGPAESQEPAAVEQEPETEGGGGACSAPRHGGPRAVDMSSVALLVGLVGLGLRRRVRR